MSSPSRSQVFATPERLRLHYVRPSHIAPSVPASIWHDIPWSDIDAVTINRRIGPDGPVKYLTFYREYGEDDATQDMEGWEDLIENLPRYLAIKQSDWQERWNRMQPEDKPILIFLRGTELPEYLREPCDMCGGTFEFQT